MNVGYVGLGSMGGALARRLQLSHPLQVYDLNAAAVANLVERGATACASLRELAAGCDVVLMCLPTSNHVREAIFGSDGLAQGLRPGTLLVDQSTGDPNATRAMAAQLKEQGIALIDAPVSGGKLGAEAGTIAIMVGAGPEEQRRVAPILAAIGAQVFHAGDVGAGQVIKLVNNLISGAQRLLAMEGIALAAKNGLDPARALEILVAGGARNVFLEKFMAPILKGNVAVGFTLGLMHKDVRLACDLGAASGVPMLFGNLAQEVYQMCINLNGADAEVHSSAIVIDCLAGTQVVPPNAQA